mgnify:FL=1
MKKPSKTIEGGQKVADTIRNIVLKDFVKWVEEAPYEETPPEEEEDTEDAVNVNNEEKEEEKKDENDDIDIDSI